MQAPIVIAGQSIEPGGRRIIELPVARLYTHTEIQIPLQVFHGRRPGPRLFVSAAIHGDEICGVEIIRRIAQQHQLRHLKGTLILVPVVNIHGFLTHSRYLPDRRDLNRSFPGSDKGSLAGRVARLFMDEVVAHCTHGIDLHTGAGHRVNLPQVRGCLNDPETKRLAQAFGAPIVLDAVVRDGSLREAVADRGIPMLLYEGGEALRFDEMAIRAGVRGVVEVMREIGMLGDKRASHRKSCVIPLVAGSSAWVRAPKSGIFRSKIRLGQKVAEKAVLGFVGDPFGERDLEVRSNMDGVVIGMTRLPLANEGDALVHIARISAEKPVAQTMQTFHSELGGFPEPWPEELPPL